MGLIAISSLMLLGGMYLMIAFAWWLLQIIANWRIFTKAAVLALALKWSAALVVTLPLVMVL